MGDRPLVPPEYWPQSSITVDDDGRLTLRWPEGRPTVEVTREVLQALVDHCNGDKPPEASDG